MKILYLASIDFYTKPNPSYHLMHSMITDLLNNNISVYFIGCKESGIDQHIPSEFANNPNFTFDLIDVPNVKKAKFVKRYLSGVSYSFKMRKYFKVGIQDCDIVFLQSSPTIVYSLIIARKYAKGKKIIYNIQDMFPGSSIASGVMPQKWMQKIFYALQKFAYKKADIITVISEDMKSKVIEQGVPEEKIHVIVNWFDDLSVHEIHWDDNLFVKKNNMKRDLFYVQYAGTMGYVFDYEMVLRVASLLRYNKYIVFQMIGEGSQKDIFLNKAKQEELNNIMFLPLESQEMVSDVYSACSVCLIPLKRGIIGNSVPSKAGLLMACNRPIINSVDENSDYYRIFNDNNIGISVSNLKAGEVVGAILSLYNDEDKAKEIAKNGHEYGKKYYSRSYNMRLYIELFKSLSGEK